MGHDAHFLERLDRVQRDELEFALALYRNHDGLAHVLEKFKWPSGAERVALSLGDDEDGPHVIVTRAGAFVTCLGAGMSPAPHPVMPRSQLDALLAKYEEHHTNEIVHAREQRDEEGGLLARVFKRRNLFSREDFQAIAFFAPLLTEQFFAKGRTTQWDVLHRMPELAQVTRPGLRIDAAIESRLLAVNSMAWAVGHLTLLAATADRQRLEAWIERSGAKRYSLTRACAVMNTSGIAFRGWWLMARLGKSQLPALKRELTEPIDTALTAFDNIASLTIVALRHKQTTAEIEKALSTATAQGDPKKKAYAELALAVLAERDDHREKMLHSGRVLFADAMTESSGETFLPENVSDDDATTMLLNTTFPFTLNEDLETFVLMMLPLIADASASAFYFPRSVVKKVLTPWTAARTALWIQEYGFHMHAPVRRENKVGRNDPCTCGSGKKWKKCCGAAP